MPFRLIETQVLLSPLQRGKGKYPENGLPAVTSTSQDQYIEYTIMTPPHQNRQEIPPTNDGFALIKAVQSRKA